MIPRELLDPDGEGIYLYDDGSFPGVVMRAALLKTLKARMLQPNHSS